MKVIAKEEGFYGGQLRKPMEEFEFHGTKLGKWMVAADGEKKPAAEKKDEDIVVEPTAAEIKAQLTAAGVEFRGNASKASLLELLKETVKKLAPASSGAPDKSLQIP